MQFLTLLEDQIVNAVSGNITATVTRGVNVTNKTYPIVTVHSGQAVEQMTPGCGVYNIPVEVRYEAKADDTTAVTFDANWQTVMQQLYQSGFDDVITTTGLHVYGYTYGNQSHDIDSTERTWSRALEFDVRAMPRNNLVTVYAKSPSNNSSSGDTLNGVSVVSGSYTNVGTVSAGVATGMLFYIGILRNQTLYNVAVDTGSATVASGSAGAPLNTWPIDITTSAGETEIYLSLTVTGA